MLIDIGGHVWETTPAMVNVLIELAKEEFKKKNISAIVAVEKTNKIVQIGKPTIFQTVVQMKKQIFDSKELLKENKNRYEEQGFKVYFVEQEIKYDYSGQKG